MITASKTADVMRRDGNATEPTAAERTGFVPAQNEIDPGSCPAAPQGALRLVKGVGIV
jgi:hypothetical protein